MKTQVTETVDELIARLRAEGRLGESSIRYIVAARRPEGAQRILPGETRAQAVARLCANFGWDERTAEFTISLSQGLSDVVPDEPMTDAEKRAIGLGVVAGAEDDEVGPG